MVSTGYDSNQNACPNTQDKIFLLSHKDVTNINYGFLVNENAKNKARQKKATDYAQIQGGGNYWWLRSPENHGSRCAQLVSSNGQVEYTNDASERYSFCNVHVTAYGIVPALQIKL